MLIECVTVCGLCARCALQIPPDMYLLAEMPEVDQDVRISRKRAFVFLFFLSYAPWVNPNNPFFPLSFPFRPSSPLFPLTEAEADKMVEREVVACSCVTSLGTICV